MSEQMRIGGSGQTASAGDIERDIAKLRSDLIAQGLQAADLDDDLKTALGSILFTDAAGANWWHDGTHWMTWGDDGPVPGRPVDPLRLEHITFDEPEDPPVPTIVDELEREWQAQPALEPPPFVPTHTVPAAGLRTWPEPRPDVAEGPRLDPFLPVRRFDQQGDWAHVQCENHWTAWVDNRLLVAYAPWSPPS